MSEGWQALRNGLPIVFLREPRNFYDPLAILATSQGLQMGHLAREVSRIIFPALDDGCVLLKGYRIPLRLPLFKIIIFIDLLLALHILGKILVNGAQLLTTLSVLSFGLVANAMKGDVFHFMPISWTLAWLFFEEARPPTSKNIEKTEKLQKRTINTCFECSFVARIVDLVG